MPDERINCITTFNYSNTPELSDYGAKTTVEYNGNCLKQDSNIYTHAKIVNIYIGCELSKNYNMSSCPTLEKCLFGAVSLTKHIDIDKYEYLEYGIGFNRHRSFSHPGDGTGRNLILFGVDVSLIIEKKMLIIEKIWCFNFC